MKSISKAFTHAFSVTASEMQLNMLDMNNKKNICASVIGFLGGSGHLALMKQHLESIREMLWGEKAPSLVVLIFKGHKGDSETARICYLQYLCSSYTP